MLANAVAAQADYLVTGDGPFRRVGAYDGIVFINPRQFFDLMNAKDPDEWAIVDELRDASKDVPDEEIEREADRVLAEVREEMQAERERTNH